MQLSGTPLYFLQLFLTFQYLFQASFFASPSPRADQSFSSPACKRNSSMVSEVNSRPSPADSLCLISCYSLHLVEIVFLQPQKFNISEMKVMGYKLDN